ncbi:MAG TPA: erythromycin esterase family protein [Longimicrobium sp.]
MPLRIRPASTCALLVLALAACDPGGGTEPEDGPDIAWLRENAVALRTTDPGGSTADLAPLRPMVQGAHVVALGEATHGTREFFRMKHRLLEYLVKELGYSTFAIEAPWAEAERLNRYVLTGEGDPEVLLSHLQYWPWNTAEVLEMIRWMRQHNQAPGAAPTVSFHGFDVQHARVAMNDVVAYLRGINPAAADSAVAHYACYRPWQDSIGVFTDYGAANAQVKESCRQGVEAAYAQVQAGAAPYTAATGAAAYGLALRAARIAVQNEHVRRDPTQRTLRREQYMAETVEWIAGPAGSGRRTVLWGHSGHVSRRQPWMGSHLGQAYGEAYRVAGFSFYEGPFSVVLEGGPLASATAPPPPDDSYEHQLHRLGMPRFMVDLRPVRAGQAPGAGWLAGPLKMRIIGSVYNPLAPQNYFFPVALTTEYDVLIHVEESTPTRLLPFRFQQSELN